VSFVTYNMMAVVTAVG